jgi:hypothetical protein
MPHRKLMCFPLAVLLLVTTAVSSALSPQTSMVGVWDFELDVTHMVGRDGFIKKDPCT